MEYSERLLGTSSWEQYGTVSTTRVWGCPQDRRVDRAEATTQRESLIIKGLPQEAKGIVKAESIEAAPEAVKKESKSVGDYIAQFFRFILGLFTCCTGKSDDIEPEPADLDDVSSSPSRVITPPREVKKKKEPAFPERSSEVFISSIINDRELSRFGEDKEKSLLRHAELDVKIVELECQVKVIREADIPEAIDRNAAVQFFGRHKNSEKLGLDAQAKEAEILELREEFLRLGSDLKTFHVQHPRFREGIFKLNEFPFQVFFGALEVKQIAPYLASRGFSRISLEFQEKLSENLESWGGQGSIDPVGLNFAAQAQLVLLRLAQNSDPLVIALEDKKLGPQTVPGTVVVNFVSKRGKPVMRVGREVQTKDGKHYRWVETVRFEGRHPVATRTVTKNQIEENYGSTSSILCQ